MFQYFFVFGLIAFVIWIIYKVGQSSAVGKPAPLGMISPGKTYKVLVNIPKKGVVVLEVVDPKRKVILVDSTNLAPGIRQNDIVHHYQSEQELNQAGVFITSNKWGVTQDFPVLVKSERV